MWMKLIPVMGTEDEISLVGVFNCFFFFLKQLVGHIVNVEVIGITRKHMLEIWVRVPACPQSQMY